LPRAVYWGTPPSTAEPAQERAECDQHFDDGRVNQDDYAFQHTGTGSDLLPTCLEGDEAVSLARR